MESLIGKFSGEGNGGKVIGQLLEPGGDPANFQPLSEIKEGHFRLLDELAVQRIVSAHKWYPELAGIMVPGKLGNSQNIRTSFEIAMDKVIEPVQKKIIEPINDQLARGKFKEYILELHTSAPISFAGEIDAADVMTDDEQRAELGLNPLTDEQKAEMVERTKLKQNERNRQND